MSENEMTTVGFLKALEEQTEAELTDQKRVSRVKKKLLVLNKKELAQVVEIGYGYKEIAAVATAELLKTGVPTTFSKTDKEGKKSTGETKYRAAEIKKFYESMV